MFPTTQYRFQMTVGNFTMTTKIMITLFALGFMFFASEGLHAQEPVRIRFQKGKSSATVRATTGPNGTSYVLRAKSGQKMVITLTPVSVLGVKVETVGRFGEMVMLREERGGTYEVGLEETGDYTIFVGPLGRNPVTFSMTVSVVKMTDI